MSTVKGYSFIQIRLHWLVAGLIIFQLIFGEDMGSAWRAVEKGDLPVMGAWVWAHISVGVAVLLLAAWRLGLRASRGGPEAPAGSARMAKAAELGHWALYALMVLAPLSGLLAWYGGVEAAAGVHELFKPLLILLIAVHVVAALYHQFVLKDGLLQRMKRPLD